MKTKTIAVLEIAIVLCSVFLVALPAIAAASEIYEPGPLDVFGNANEDDTIDMRDTTYIKLAIFGKKPKTKLADANYDGKISMLDVGQTKLIILGKEKKLTFIDILGEPETVNKPIKRLANIGYRGIEVTRVLDAMDILLPVIGYDRSGEPIYHQEFSKWPVVGYEPDKCDFEYILSLEPDAIMTNIESVWALHEGAGLEDKREFKEKLPDIPIISLNTREPDVLPQNMRTYGYIIDRKEEADEFIDWFDKHFNAVKDRTEGFSEGERPRGMLISNIAPYKLWTPSSRLSQAIIAAGGRNILDTLIGKEYLYSILEVDPEWLIEQNPEFIFKTAWFGKIGYETDDPSEMAAMRQEIVNCPVFANSDAVKTGNVYTIDSNLISGPQIPIGTVYMAKLFHPDLFTDMDPQEIHQEYLDRFWHIDFEVKEHGVFVYPAPEWE